MSLRRAKPNLMNARRKQQTKQPVQEDKNKGNLNEASTVTTTESTTQDVGTGAPSEVAAQIAEQIPDQLYKNENVLLDSLQTEQSIIKNASIERNAEAILTSAEARNEINTSIVDNSLEEITDANKLFAVDVAPATEIAAESNSFKQPPRVEYNRNCSHNSSSNLDDIFHSDIEDNVIQIDMQRSASGFPMSPTKLQARRIRATPIFGQRRNSFVGTTPPATPQPIEELNNTAIATDFAMPTHRRERHHSASLSQNANIPAPVNHYHHTPHKFTPTMGLGRIRTESGCSAFSDSYAASTKSRKADEHSHHRNMSRRDFEARFTNGVPDKSMLKMFDLIYYNPATNPMEQKPNVSNIKMEGKPTTGAVVTADDVKAIPATTNEAESNDDSSNAMPVPQLRLNANGELILDDKSLVIETTAEQEARKVLANSSVIYLDENTGMNGFYKRHKRTKEWPPEETIKFYRCLQTLGTDFSLMCHLFPKRTRRDLKLKFKKEERCNALLINKALLYPKTFNIEDLKTQLDAEEREREEEERKWREVKAKEAKPIKRITVKTSTAARVLKNGDDIYQNENVLKRKISKRASKAASAKMQSTTANAVTTPAMTTLDSTIPATPTIITLTSPTTTTKSRKRSANEASNAPGVVEVKPKLKRRRRQTKRIIYIEAKVECNNLENVPIKTEHIKPEHFTLSTQYVVPQTAILSSALDANQLENDITELLKSDTNTKIDNARYYEIHGELSENAPTEFITADNIADEESLTGNNNSSNNKTFVNLDDGTLTFVSGTEVSLASAAPSVETFTLEPDMAANVNSEFDTELNELDIQQILMELAQGTLVLVSTLDPANDKMLNEIYMLNEETGELCDTPLDIPDEIVQSVLAVMS